MTDISDVVTNLQVMTGVADYIPSALVNCGVTQTEKKYRKYKISYVRTNIDPDSIEWERTFEFLLIFCLVIP